MGKGGFVFIESQIPRLTKSAFRYLGICCAITFSAEGSSVLALLGFCISQFLDSSVFRFAGSSAFRFLGFPGLRNYGFGGNLDFNLTASWLRAGRACRLYFCIHIYVFQLVHLKIYVFIRVRDATVYDLSRSGNEGLEIHPGLEVGVGMLF